MPIDPLNITQIGPYPVRRFIAKGGMAWVFEVQDPRFGGQEVVRALKMLMPEAAAGEEFQRFQSEAGLLAGINHTNLVTIFDFGQDPETDCFYYTMTYVDGPTMGDYLKQYGRLAPEDVGRLFLEILSALSELHDRDIVHRDIKPGNVLIGSDGRARLADLGIARTSEDTGLTRTGMAVGTVLYMSPEQARGHAVAPSSDIFSVGLTLFETLIGERIYDRIEDVDSTSQHDVLGYLVALARTGEDIELSFPPELQIDPNLQAVIRKACHYRQEDRYQDARAMHGALEAALYGAGTGEVPVPQVSGPRWPLLAAAGALAVAAMGAGLWFYWWMPSQQKAAAVALMERVEPLRTDAPALLQRVKDLEPRPTEAEIDTVDDALRTAQLRWRDAQRKLEAERWDDAQEDFQSAEAGYTDACTKLGSDTLLGRADASVASLTARVETLRAPYSTLRDAGAPAALEQVWRELERRLGELRETPAQEACETVATALDRIDGAGGAGMLIADIEAQLGDALRELAPEARERADLARGGARAVIVEAAEYKAALREGDDYFARADVLVKREPLQARDLFQQAIAAFETASHIVPAVTARSEMKRIEEELIKAGIPTRSSSAARMSTQGASHYDNRSWEAAARSYDDAAQELLRLLGTGRLRQEARKSLANAASEQQRAIADGADRASLEQFELAERELASGQYALDGDDFETAVSHFDRAGRGYRGAIESANEALGEARAARREFDSRRKSALGQHGCGKLEPASAERECEAALAEAARGNEELDGFKAGAALLAFRNASAAIDRTRNLMDEWERTRPHDPQIVERSPKRAAVSVLRGSPLRLSVKAQDRNDEPLTFTWQLAGRLIAGADGPRLDFTPRVEGTVTVTATDPTGRSDSAAWKVAFRNRPPSLEVNPSVTKLRRERGSAQLFEARTSDPDGDRVSVEYHVDGKIESRGSSYTFQRSEPGTYNLKVVARDARGATTSAERQITVLPGTHFAPAREPWEKGVVATLKAYEAALEDKNMQKLEKVWRLSDPLRDIWTRRFRRYHDISIRLTVSAPKKRRTDQAHVTFEQVESLDNRPPRSYQISATLLERSAGWQIVQYKRELIR